MRFSDGETYKPISPEMLMKLRNVTAYNKFSSPDVGEGMLGVTPVIVNVHLEYVSSVRAQTMDFVAEIDFNISWQDKRLSSPKRFIVKDKEVADLFWNPGFYFPNAIKSSYHPDFVFRVEEDGTIEYDFRVSLTVVCNMNLAKYPLDRHLCYMKMMSYAYTDEDVHVSWLTDRDPVSKNPEITIADMEIISVKPGPSCNATFGPQNMTRIIVAVSWLGLWIDPKAAPARVALLITTLLTITTQANAARQSLPAVGYLKAMDVWLGAQMGFVFAAMIEFIFAHKNCSKDGKDISRVDNIGRIVLPSAYVLFNIGYWLYYLVIFDTDLVPLWALDSNDHSKSGA